MTAITRPFAAPVVSPSQSSFDRTRQSTLGVMSPSAMPRTTTVAVCVVPMPPIDATIGMNTASIARAWMDDSNKPMTDAARTAVPRLTNRHVRRFRNTAFGGSNTVSSPATPPRRWMSSVASSRRMSMTSSTPIVPRSRRVPCPHGDLDQVVALDEARDLLLVGVHRHALHVLGADRPDGRRGVRGDQTVERDEADQVVVVVHDVDVEGAVARLRLADVLDRPRHRHRLRHGDEVGRHEAARGALGVLEEDLDLLGFLLLHEVQELLGLLLRELLDDVHDLVGGHAIEGARDFRLVERADQLAQDRVVELGEDRARLLGREEPEHAHLVLERELADHA